MMLNNKKGLSTRAIWAILVIAAVLVIVLIVIFAKNEQDIGYIEEENGNSLNDLDDSEFSDLEGGDEVFAEMDNSVEYVE